MARFQTKCGGRIVTTRKVEEHLLAHKEMQVLLAETLSHIELPKDGAFLATEVEMGRVIGFSGCVKTPPISEGDVAQFAKRIARPKPSRIIVGDREVTTKAVVLAHPSRTEPNTYMLVSAWAGTLAEKEPWDRTIATPEEFQKSLDFWCTHALVYDHAVMGEPFESTWSAVIHS